MRVLAVNGFDVIHGRIGGVRNSQCGAVARLALSLGDHSTTRTTCIEVNHRKERRNRSEKLSPVIVKLAGGEAKSIGLGGDGAVSGGGRESLYASVVFPTGSRLAMPRFRWKEFQRRGLELTGFDPLTLVDGGEEQSVWASLPEVARAWAITVLLVRLLA